MPEAIGGLRLNEEDEFEVLAACIAGVHDIPAVAATPGWYVVGAFECTSPVLVRLQLIGLVTADTLTLRGRLYRIGETPGEVSGSLVAIAATDDVDPTVDVEAKSGAFQLVAGVYQFQAEALGGVGDSLLGVVKTMTMVSAQ